MSKTGTPKATWETLEYRGITALSKYTTQAMQMLAERFGENPFYSWDASWYIINIRNISLG